MIAQTIKERTARGEFAASGSSGERARRYNKDYAKRKMKPLQPVTLRDEGDMLRDLFGDFEPPQRGELELTATYDFATEESRQKAEYHNTEGAGRNYIKRRFLYLTKREAERIVAQMKRILL
jgi:hypothetical protein